MIEDFALSDYLETPGLTFLWFCVTIVGFVVMMNTLIAGELILLASSLICYHSSSNGSILCVQ